MTIFANPSVRNLFAMSLLCFSLVGCSGSKTAQQHLDDASAYEQAGDIASAILAAKNAVQLEPDNRDARLKLGYLQLGNGDYAGALKELEKVRNAGRVDDDLQRAITRSLIMLGRHEQAATELALHGDFENFEWRRLQATLDLHVGRFEDARDTYSELLKAHPEDGDLRANLVASLLQLGEVETAKNILNEAIDAETDNAGLWMIKGQLAVIDQQYEQAAEAYQRVLALRPNAYSAMLGRIVAITGLNRFDDAASLLAKLPNISKDDIRVTYIRGVVAEGKGNISEALGHYRSVIQTHPEHEQSLQKLARLHFKEGDADSSIQYLQRLTALFPNNAEYRKQLGAAQLATGRMERAFEELTALEVDIQHQTDAQLLALLGSAYAKQGQYAEGIESLARAFELQPDSTPIAIQLALSYLRAGEIKDAVAILENVYAREPSNVTAKVLLILGYAQISPAKSQTLLAEEINANPDKALPVNIRGFLAMQGGKLDTARQDFEQAIDIDSNFLPPYFNLARLDIAEGDIPAAMNKLERVLAVDDKNGQAYLALGELANRVNKPDLALRYWEKARDYDPNAGTPRAAIARYYRTEGQLDKARQVIDEAYQVASHQPIVQYEYAQTHLLQGDSEGARPAVNKLSTRFPESLRVLELEVALNRLSGDDDALILTLNKLIERAPASVKPYQLLVASHLRKQQLADARKVANELMKVDDKKHLAHELLGDISFSEITEIKHSVNITKVSICTHHRS